MYWNVDLENYEYNEVLEGGEASHKNHRHYNVLASTAC